MLKIKRGGTHYVYCSKCGDYVGSYELTGTGRLIGGKFVPHHKCKPTVSEILKGEKKP